MTSNEPTVSSTPSPRAPATDDLEYLINHHQEEAIASGHPPLHLTPWRNACKRSILENERLYPGYVARAAAGLRARTNGQRLTGWREVRGTHGITHVPDPQGTDKPPWA
jgi:hypothetical protein